MTAAMSHDDMTCQVVIQHGVLLEFQEFRILSRNPVGIPVVHVYGLAVEGRNRSTL